MRVKWFNIHSEVPPEVLLGVLDGVNYSTNYSGFHFS